MAKFDISIELNWLENEEGIDEALKKEVIAGLKNTVTAKAQKEIDAALTEIVQQESNKIIEKFLNNTFENAFNNLKIPMKKGGSWSNEIEFIPLSEYVGKQYEQHLNKKVYAYDGSIPRYESDAKLSISEFFINRYLEKELTKKVSDMIKDARKDAELTIVKTLEDNLKAQLSVDIIKRLNIPEMLKALQEKAVALGNGETEVNHE